MELTFSKGYAVFLQVAHLSCVPENMEENLLAALDCKITVKKFTCITYEFELYEHGEKEERRGFDIPTASFLSPAFVPGQNHETRIKPHMSLFVIKDIIRLADS